MEKRCISLQKTLAWLLVSLAIMAPWQPVFAADVRVIASANAPVDAMSAKMIKGVFLGKRTTWADGRPIEFVTLAGGGVHEAFLRMFVGKTAYQFSNYWKKQMYTGKGAVPKSFTTESELVDYVAGRPGAVGYVSGTADVTAVKVVNEK